MSDEFVFELMVFIGVVMWRYLLDLGSIDLDGDVKGVWVGWVMVKVYVEKWDICWGRMIFVVLK